MSRGLWFYNEDGSECGEPNWGPPIRYDLIEEELDQLMGEAMKAAPGTKPTPVQRDEDGTLI